MLIETTNPVEMNELMASNTDDTLVCKLEWHSNTAALPNGTVLRQFPRLPFSYFENASGEWGCVMNWAERATGDHEVVLTRPGTNVDEVPDSDAITQHYDGRFYVRVPSSPSYYNAKFVIRPVGGPIYNAVIAGDTLRGFSVTTDALNTTNRVPVGNDTVRFINRMWQVKGYEVVTGRETLLFACELHGEVMFFENRPAPGDAAIARRATRCRNCDNWTWAHDEQRAVSCGYYLCAECQAQRQQAQHSVETTFTQADIGPVQHYTRDAGFPVEEVRYQYDYDYKPKWSFAKTELDTGKVLYLGVEQEFSTNTHRDKAGLCAAIHGCDQSETHFFQKYDGTLNNGTEVVTHPRTLRYWQTTLRPQYEALLQTVRDAGVIKGRDNDGMHIHMSSASMTMEHKAAMVALFWVLRDSFEPLVGRSYTDHEYAAATDLLSEYDSDVLSSIGDRVCAAVYTLPFRITEKYAAVNTLPSRTVEVRVFHSTANVNEFYTRLELAHAAYQFTKHNIHDVFEHYWEPVELWYKFVGFVRVTNHYTQSYAELEAAVNA